MPRVHFSGQAARRFTGGATELEVEADTFRRMVLELDRRFPGLGRQIDESMAVAIDGEIFQDAYLARRQFTRPILATILDLKREKNSPGRRRVIFTYRLH